MSLSHILQEIESQFQELTNGWWDDDGVAQLQRKMSSCANGLKHGYAALMRTRTTVERLRRRVAELEHDSALLTQKVEIYHHVADRTNSWNFALELDRTQRALQANRVQLQANEKLYYHQLAEVQLIKRRLAELQERAYLTQERVV